MRRSVRVALTVTPALSMALSGCAAGAASADDEPTHQAICVDPETEQRVDDDECDDDGRLGVGGWYFLALGARFPAIGQAASGGSRAAPSTPHVRGGLPTAAAGTVSTATATRGTTVTRGGFGSSGGTGSGG